MNNSSRRIERATLEVDRTVNPDWISGAERTPTAGEEVFCTGGGATVVKVLGKTSDGSRLLELKLVEGDGKPFFAAASNVMVPPSPAIAA